MQERGAKTALACLFYTKQLRCLDQHTECGGKRPVDRGSTPAVRPRGELTTRNTDNKPVVFHPNRIKALCENVDETYRAS